MIQSMTGYGASEVDGLKVEVRSLNHKYIDISVRMPSVLMEHEIPIRNIVKEKFARGKLDVTVSLSEKRQLKVRVNKELAQGIYDTLADLQKELSLPGSLDIDFFSQYRELIMTEEPEYSAEALYNALRDAVSRVETMRKSEGEILMKELKLHAAKLEELRAEVERLSKGMAQQYKEALSRKVAELISDALFDETRLAQEVALLAQRSDITEELARLGSHIQQLYSFLSDGNAIGRKLDFLMQELHREANTITSKVDDVKIINLAIGMKTEIEKLREQVQNIQ
ncbi:MAG: YicC family protein [Nitrospirae bacterium]|nr:YicC family protein [Nitrospirota bacterium]MCL5236277.1 YicC family protein [Nitrospirota bacterium]